MGISERGVRRAGCTSVQRDVVIGLCAVKGLIPCGRAVAVSGMELYAAVGSGPAIGVAFAVAPACPERPD